MTAAFNGLDLLLVALVIGGAFALSMLGAFRIQDWEDELDRRWLKAMEHARWNLDVAESERDGASGVGPMARSRSLSAPFDWAVAELEFDEATETTGGLA